MNGYVKNGIFEYKKNIKTGEWDIIDKYKRRTGIISYDDYRGKWIIIHSKGFVFTAAEVGEIFYALNQLDRGEWK